MNFILSGIAILSFCRVILGPTPYDRLIGFNLASGVITVIMVVYAVELNRIIYMDVALVYALLSFIGVIAIAKYLRAGDR
ncbi:cation:proton antiporter [Candidatus Desantisbacteria bacterium CG_4_10_14_0_8_um_filter_39_17]|uniref:Cation:proton antiporter n=1 Tax=Candidatus Desantisbacteria bacterium CG_4_10_14_0_8_um_filter_39_17 TaxID=1974542 RepID=A0A2H9PCU9_9BACT|nr:MAG: cation:proton antiporter [Candidatus Desantisbacteria bacterium CG_4_10_14_0_8_um_filter_39_17]